MPLRVRLYDADHAALDEVVRYRELRYARVLNGVGELELVLGADSPHAALVADNGWLRVTWDGREEFYGIVQERAWAFDPDGDEVLTVTALHANALLGWREIVPPAGASHDSRSGPADNVMKAYVRAHLGSGAGARLHANVSVAADASAAPSKSYRARYPLTLLQALGEIAVAGSVDFEMVRVAGGVEFRTYYPRRGLDRSKGNGTNPPAVFARRLGNTRRGRLRVAGQGVVNHVLVLGQGEGAQRTVVEREDTASKTAWSRREAAVDARHLSATADLQQRGDEVLSERKVDRELTLEAMSVPGSTYGIDWDLGDLVTGEVAGEEMDAVVSAVSVVLVPRAAPQVRAVIGGA